MNNGRLVLYALKAGSQHCRYLPIVLHLVESWHQGERPCQSRQPARRLTYLGLDFLTSLLKHLYTKRVLNN